MPITNVNGVVTETPPTDADQAGRSGTGRADQFAICDRFDRFKQLRFDVSAQSPGKTVTIAAGANSSDIVLTLPTTSGTLKTTGLTSVTSNDNTITPTLSGDGSTLDLQFADPIGWLRQKPYLWDDMWGWANSGTTPLNWWTTFQSNGNFSYVYNTPSITNGHPGVSRLTPNTSATGYVAMMTEQRQIVFDSTKTTHTLECMAQLAQTATVSEDFLCALGFGDNILPAIIAQGAWFEYDRTSVVSGTNWLAKTGNGASSYTTVDTGIAVDTSWHKFKIVINASNHAIFYIDGVQVADISTNLPSSSYPTNITLIIQKTAGSAAKNLYIDYVYYEPKLVTTR